MSEEDKVLVEAFSGSESEYNKIYENQQYYLINNMPVYLPSNSAF